MNRHISLDLVLRKVYLLSALLFILLSSCRNDGSLVPQFNTAILNIGDTVVMATSATTPGDSLLTSGVISRNIVGKVNDDIFGLSKAELYTEFYMPQSSLTLHEDFIAFDSIVLELGYNGYFGYDYEQAFEVYEITEAMDDQSYYSNRSVATSDVLLGSAKLEVNSSDTLFTDSTYILKIKLDNDFGTKIVEQRVFNDQAAFLELVKGLHIKSSDNKEPNPGEGAMIYFDLRSSLTRLKMYYPDIDGSPTSLNFTVSSAATRFSSLENSYASSLVNAFGKEDLPFNYVSALAGPRTRIRFDGVHDFAAQLPLGINKAELVIPYEDQPISNYPPPERLSLIKKDSEGNFVVLEDQILSLAYFGGNLELSNQQYRFDLAKEFHDMITTGDYDREFYLAVSGGAVIANRLVLNSGIHPTRPIHLVVTFTKPK